MVAKKLSNSRVFSPVIIFLRLLAGFSSMSIFPGSRLPQERELDIHSSLLLVPCTPGSRHRGLNLVLCVEYLLVHRSIAGAGNRLRGLAELLPGTAPGHIHERA